MIASLFVHTDRVPEKIYGCFFSHGLESTECYRALFSYIDVIPGKKYLQWHFLESGSMMEVTVMVSMRNFKVGLIYISLICFYMILGFVAQ